VNVSLYAGWDIWTLERTPLRWVLKMYPIVMEQYAEKRKFDIMLHRMDGKKLARYKLNLETVKAEKKLPSVVDIERAFGVRQK
jgi:hypothetical protein